MDKDKWMKDEVYKELKVSFQSVEQRIKEKKEYREELRFKVTLYNECLDERLLEKGSKLIKEHLAAAEDEIKVVEHQINELNLQRDAYRIEIEIFEKNFRD